MKKVITFIGCLLVSRVSLLAEENHIEGVQSERILINMYILKPTKTVSTPPPVTIVSKMEDIEKEIGEVVDEIIRISDVDYLDSLSIKTKANLKQVEILSNSLALLPSTVDKTEAKVLLNSVSPLVSLCLEIFSAIKPTYLLSNQTALEPSGPPIGSFSEIVTQNESSNP